MTFEERLGPPSSDAAARTSVERQCWSIEEMEVGAADSGDAPLTDGPPLLLSW